MNADDLNLDGATPADLAILEQAGTWAVTVAQAVERTTDRLVSALQQLQEEQAEIRDDLTAVAHRLEGVTRAVGSFEQGDARLLRRDLEALQGDVRDLERRADS